MEKQKNKIIHIGIIILGSIFIMIGLFHNNMWFDETYSVALVKHSFYDIWMIGGNDVHPTLYVRKIPCLSSYLQFPVW